MKKFMTCFLFITSVVFADNPWVQSFTPLRTIKVETETKLKAAINSAKPGDLIEIGAGTYKIFLKTRKDGTEEHPIVFRAAPGVRVKIEGSVELRAYNWLWGCEITDPTGWTEKIARNALVMVSNTGGHLINCVIHESTTDDTKNGVVSWSDGPGVVIYGNLIYHNRHNAYMQHDYDRFGYKYVINNMFFDATRKFRAADPFNIHFYGSGSASKTGLYAFKNIFFTGRSLIGGGGYPIENIIFDDNVIYDQNWSFGYALNNITQAKIRRNYFARATFDFQHAWGAGEVCCTRKEKIEITDNTFVFPDQKAISFTTTLSTSAFGIPRILSTDIVDRNKYPLKFLYYFKANNVPSGKKGLEAWRAASKAAGNEFDTNGVEIPSPKNNYIVINSNEYDRHLAHMAIFNWKGTPGVNVDFSDFVAAGSVVKVFDARQPFGPPVFSGEYVGASISIPTPAEFNAYQIRFGKPLTPVISSNVETLPKDCSR